MSLLNIAQSALLSYQHALSVTGHNIANSTTPGYSRQAIMFKANASSRLPFFSGQGVSVDQILRFSNDFANQQVRKTSTDKSQFDAFYQQALQVDKLLSSEGTSIAASLQTFFTSLGQLNDSPDDTVARGVALNQCQRMVDQFNAMQKKLDEHKENNHAQISAAIDQINQITANIAMVNRDISSGINSPDLLDTRDELLKELSQYVQISTIEEPDGSLNVSIAGGEMLVTGSRAEPLTVRNISVNNGTRIFLANGTGNIDISNKFTTGMIGGLRDFESNILDKSSKILGQMAVGLAQAFNAQHKMGVDLNGQFGGNMFTDFNNMTKQLQRSIAATGNAGTGVLSVAISDTAQLQPSDYSFTVTNTATQQISMVRQSDGQVMTLNWTDTPPAPPAAQIVVDGMTITIDDVSHLANNDQFTIMPLQDAAKELQLMIQDPSKLALASAVRTHAPVTNKGSGKIDLRDFFHTANSSKQYRIDFISPTQYNVVNVTDATSSGPFSFTPDTDNIISIPDGSDPAYTIVLSGSPEQGDQFFSGFNNDGRGDNRNGLKLNALQQLHLFAGGTETLSQRYSGLISQVGSKTWQADIGSKTAEILHNQAMNYRESSSGVNQEEELGNLINFEKAYRAAAELMATSSNMFDVLFDAMR